MRLRRTLGVALLVGALAVPITAGPAGAETRNVSGTLSGPGGFRFQGCNGVVTEIGSGTYTTTGLGSGTYAFNVCITSSPLVFVGTVTFTRRTGATLLGTIVGTVESGGWPLFTVTVTGGTRRYAKARGTLMMGPLVESSPHNCDPLVGICLDWTDTGPVVGRLTHVHRHD